MGTDIFTERLGQIRQRFLSTFDSKIADTYAALPYLSAAAPAGIEAVGESYRRVHGICGIGASVGFPAIGKAAREAELILLPAFRAGRALSAEEAAAFALRLDALTTTARRELQAG